MEEYLTIKQASALLQVSRKTIESWLHSGRLPGKKFGKLWRIRRSDLDTKTEATDESGK